MYLKLRAITPVASALGFIWSFISSWLHDHFVNLISNYKNFIVILDLLHNVRLKQIKNLESWILKTLFSNFRIIIQSDINLGFCHAYEWLSHTSVAILAEYLEGGTYQLSGEGRGRASQYILITFSGHAPLIMMIISP